MFPGNLYRECEGTTNELITEMETDYGSSWFQLFIFSLFSTRDITDLTQWIWSQTLISLTASQRETSLSGTELLTRGIDWDVAPSDWQETVRSPSPHSSPALQIQPTQITSIRIIHTLLSQHRHSNVLGNIKQKMMQFEGMRKEDIEQSIYWIVTVGSQ